MLKCINCNKEFPEKINLHACPKCTSKNKLNYTNLYSTTYKHYPQFEASLLQRKNNVLFLKREDLNKPSGLFKDRKSAFIHSQYIPSLALASSGNQAISLAKYYESMSFMLVNTYLYVSPYISEEKLKILKKYYDITFTDRILSTEEIIRGEKHRWNITNGMDPYGASAYYNLAMELENYQFHYIFVPCGSGELYTALSVYFHLLRKKNCPKIIPVQSKMEETDALNVHMKFVATQPFIDCFAEKFNQYPYIIEDSIKTFKNLTEYSNRYKCELSSAVVFEAYEKMGLAGKTCLIVTGVKK